MKLNELYPILKNENGESVPCSNPGCRRKARHQHHLEYRCDGGNDSPDNLIHLCDKCHRQIHMDAGDFRKWGKLGGQITAQKGVSIPNLVQFQGTEGAARWAAYCQRKAMQQMGVWVS